MVAASKHRALSLEPTRDEPEPAAATDTAKPIERLVRGGKVRFFPSPGGVIRIVGMAEDGEWIAEFSCREEDFTEAFLRRMERHVAQKVGARLAVI